MTEINRLQQWMAENNYTFKSLAHELGVGYYGVYLIFHRNRISPGFRIRFSERFGTDIAGQIFDPFSTPKAILEPA